MKETALKYQLLAELLRSLEAEGFTFGVGKHLQMQQLLAQLPAEVTIEDFAPIFAPLLCTSDKEQQRFYEIFADSLARVEAVNTPPKSAVIEPIDATQKRLKWLLWILGIPVLVALGYLVYQDIGQVVHERPKVLKNIPFTIEPDSTVIKKIPTEELTDFVPIVRLGMGRDSVQRVDSTRFGRYEVKDSLRIQFRADTLVGQDSAYVFLYDSLGHCATVLLNAIIKKSPPRLATEKSDSVTTAAYTPRFRPIENYPYPNDILSLQVDPVGGVETFIAKHIHWLKPLFLFLAALLFWVIIKYRESKRRKLIAELESKNKPPYIWNIDIPNVENIELGEDYDQVLNKLRQRTADEYRRLDLAQTVKATIQNAGMVDFRYRQMTRPPEYLLLIDQQSGSNHQAQLFDYLYRSFREEEIYIERFFFDGDPRLCYNAAYPAGIALKELQQRFYNARLLLVTNGYSLLSPFSGKLAKWTDLFSPWQQRSLLSPRPTADWGRREQQLEERFRVLPASLQGLDYLVEQWDAGEDANFSDWAAKVTDAPRTAIELTGGLIPSLKQHYSPEMLRWIAACAVYPALHWDLTLYLGQLLATPDQPLLSVANLMQLNRLPWLVQGEMPPEVRALLIDWLEQHHPATLQLVRERLQDVLQQNQPPQDSVAWEDYSMNIALNEWLRTQDQQRKKELEKEIAQKLEAGIEADFTVVKYLDRERTPLDFMVPNSWKKYIHHGGRTGLGWKEIWKEVLAAGLLWLGLLALVIWYQPKEICAGELVTDLPFMEEGKVLCIATPADRILLNEWLAREALGRREFETVDSLIEDSSNQPIDLLQYPILSSDSLYSESIMNLAVDYYNFGVPYGNQADSLLQLQDTLYQSQRDSACIYHFAAAYRLDSLNNSIRNAQRWCLNSNITYPLASFGLSKSDCCAPCTVEVINASRDASYYNWDFGNGETSQEARPFAPSYEQPGTYTIQLIARNAQATDTLSKSFEICDSTVIIDKDVDTDGDGIVDSEDECPDKRGIVQNKGCPKGIVKWQKEIDIFYSNVLEAMKTKVAAQTDNVALVEDYKKRLSDARLKKIDELKKINPEINDWLVGLFKIEANELLLELRKKIIKESIDAQPTDPTTSADCPSCPEMVFVQGGTFEMGCTEEQSNCKDDEKPVHSVTLSDFYIGKYEVTQQQWQNIMGDNPSSFKGCANCPVESVSWNDIQDFIIKLNQRTDRNYRLPTEAEWEYAARGGQKSKMYLFAGSNDADTVAWYYYNSANKTEEVGTRISNELGIYDMSGNVWERCQDLYGIYPSTAQTNPRGANNGSFRVIRGGSWDFNPRYCRVASRSRSGPEFSGSSGGFRLVHSSADKQ